MTMLGEERAMYGRIRLGGTIGWGLFAPIAGLLVQNYGLKIAFWTFSLIMFINFFISQRFVHVSHEKDGSNPGGIRVLLTNRRWIHFLSIAFLGGFGGFAVSAYLFPYLAELGAKESLMGIGLMLSTITEMPIFFFGHRLVKRFTSHGLLMIAIVMMGIRCLLYAAASTPLIALVIQAMGGMIFPAMWLAGVSYADENAPIGLKSSAQGLFGAMTFGVGSAVGGFVGGPLLQSMGGRGMFLVFGVVVFFGLIIAEGIRRLFPDKSELPQVVAVASDK
jgi:PPP family 3-phenylpropionic acid transporter